MAVTKEQKLVHSLQNQITQLQGALAQAGTELSLAKVEIRVFKEKESSWNLEKNWNSGSGDGKTASGGNASASASQNEAARRNNDKLRLEAIEKLKADFVACQAELNALRKSMVSASNQNDGTQYHASFLHDMNVLKMEISESMTKAIITRAQCYDKFGNMAEGNNGNGGGNSGGSASSGSDSEGKKNNIVLLEHKVNLLQQKSLKDNSKIEALHADIEHLKVDLSFEKQKTDRLTDDREAVERVNADLKKKLKYMQESVEKEKLREKHNLIQYTSQTTALTSSGDSGKKEGGNEESAGNPNGDMTNLSNEDALRSEVKTKDMALWLAHFEVKKEKKRRESAETKAKGMAEKMQKLMFICERNRQELLDAKTALERKEREVAVKFAQVPQAPQQPSLGTSKSPSFGKGSQGHHGAQSPGSGVKKPLPSVAKSGNSSVNGSKERGGRGSRLSSKGSS